MKKLLTVLTLALTAFGSYSQLQWDYLGGIPIEMNSPIASCFYFNFDSDLLGSNEIKIVHGKNSGCYITSTTSTPVYMPTNRVSGVDMWSDCNNNNFFNWNSDTAYISKGNARLAKGNHVLPFKYNEKIGYFVIKITEGSDTLKVRGYKFNINPRDFECYKLIEPRSSVRNVSSQTMLFKEFNHMGQPVDEFYSGLVIRVYEDGTREQVIKNPL